MTVTQRNIISFFEEQALKAPNRIAVVFENNSLTYRQLNEQSNQYAHYLREMGVESDKPIALCLERSAEMLIIILAILKAGAAYVPLDPSHPIERLLFILKDNHSPILMLSSALKNKFRQYHGPKSVIDSPKIAMSTYPNHNPDNTIAPHCLAYVIYTSGTTGQPKGVLIEQHSVVQYALWFAEYCPCKSKQRIDFSSNYVFDMAVTTSIVALMLGLTIVIGTDKIKENSRNYLNYLNDHKINMIKITPSYFKTLLHEIKNQLIPLPYLESIILGGENLSAVDCIDWITLYPKHVLFNEYGPTETTVAISYYAIHHKNRPHLNANIPIGKPSSKSQCCILNPDRVPVPLGEIGELYISGACLARGYLNQPELSDERFIQHEGARFYKTGDLCRQRSDGMLECLGRVDYQLKIHGFRVEPAEIEQALMTHLSIKDVVVMAQNSTHQDKQLVAYIILNEKARALTIQQLRHYLVDYLPHYMIPTFFVTVDAFPLNANGKLDRDALPSTTFSSNRHYRAPKTALQKRLATIWGEELGLKSVGIEDDFFELGGYSLSAARIISSITDALEKEVALPDFYNAATIQKLAILLKKIPKRQATPLLSNNAIHHDNAILPLSDFQLLIWLCNNFEPNAQKINIVARKRFEGRVNKDRLSRAFAMLLEKHEAISFHVFKFRPAQRFQKNLSFNIMEHSLLGLPQDDGESRLNASINELLYFHPWKKKSPLMIARLFRMDGEIDELQISLSHLISDGVSSDLLLSDLSKFYLLCDQEKVDDLTINRDKHYRSYLALEQHYFQSRLNTDHLFWDHYLKDTHLFAFPHEQVLDDLASKGLPYSTYLDLPEQALLHLQQFSAEHHVSISDGLTAALLLALLEQDSKNNASANTTHPLFVSRVKSTRDNRDYDQTIACFLRIESIKVHLNEHATMASLAEQIHQSTIDTAAFQRCASLIKIASVATFYKKRKRLQNTLIQSFTYLYSKVVKSLQFNRHLLNLCGRLAIYERDHHFLININIQHDLIPHGQSEKIASLFGLKTRPIPRYRHDLLKTSNVLDVCFLRDNDQNIPYLVISATLNPDYRQRIAESLLKIITNLTLEKAHLNESALCQEM